MAEFRTLAKAKEIPPGKAKAFPVGPKTIALFNDGGQYYAIDDLCPHMGASLAEGAVADGAVACCWHAWRFKLSDGTWVDSPKLKIGSYAVRLVGDEVQVEC